MTEKKMQLVDWLDDLCVRFIVNLPEEELNDVSRICFQVEEAQWFYEDFVRPTDPTLPSLNLHDFCLRIFQHCPLTSAFSNSQHTQAFQQFLEYKQRVPVRGAILLNHEMDQILLVKGWKKSATWSFPRGKINKDEKDLDCAIREVWEETGYNLKEAGLVPADENVHAIDVTMREQHLRMFVFRGVPLDTVFEAQTRKEISKIGWWELATMPGTHRKEPRLVQGDAQNGAIDAKKLYMVVPFMPPLKKWINRQRKMDAGRALHPEVGLVDADRLQSETPTEFYTGVASTTVDPTAELKQMLSIGAPAQVALQPPAPQPHQGQANALLSMLRGGPPSANLAPPATSVWDLPETPMDQMIGEPSEPATPRYQHAKASPETMRQPPPGFPFSPDPQPRQETARLMNHLGLGRVQDNQFAGLPTGPGPMQPNFASPQNPGFFSNMQGQNNFPSHSRPVPPALLPQGGDGPLAHGPAAPKAKQLPHPRLNNHTMNLLNSFRAPVRQQQAQMQGQVHDYNQQQYPTSGQGQAGFPSLPSQQQSFQTQNTRNMDQGMPIRQNQPPTSGMSAHHNSLLGLFHSPEANRATPAPQAVASQPPIANVQQRAVSSDVVQASAPKVLNAPSAEQPKQRSATLAMLTRTLPKAKATTTPPPLPKPPVHTTTASSVGQQAQKEPSITQDTGNRSTATAAAALKPAMTLLSRPASVTKKISPSPALLEGSSSGNRTRPPSKASHAAPPPGFTILQRPADVSPAKTPVSLPASPPRPETSADTTKPFQPQLLKRPKVEDSATPVTSRMQSPTIPQEQQQGGNGQRDTLLALFAKQGLGSTSGVSTTPTRTPSVMAAASPLPTPTLDRESFRTRLASNASATSARDGEGLKSPTPGEAKDFLLGFLHGVVRDEHYKGVKRPQF